MQGVMSGGLPEMRCSVPSPSSLLSSSTCCAARSSSQVVPGRKGPVVAIELREGLALVGNGKARNARWIDLRGQLPQGRAAGRPPVIDLLLEPAGSRIGKDDRGAAFGNSAAIGASQAIALVAVVDESMPMTRSPVMYPNEENSEAAMKLPPPVPGRS